MPYLRGMVALNILNIAYDFKTLLWTSARCQPDDIRRSVTKSGVRHDISKSSSGRNLL